MVKIEAVTSGFGFVATFFFFLGFVVFREVETIFFGATVNPYVVTGFGLLFVSMLVHFRRQIFIFFDKL